MKKKILAILLIVSMVICPFPTFAANFSDTLDFTDASARGSGEEPAAGVESPEDAFSDGTEEISRESGSGNYSELFSDAESEKVALDAVEPPVLAAQNTYQISVSGELIYSETQKFVELLNAERTKLGRPPVQLDQEMMDRAVDRTIQGSVAYGHYLPDGTYVQQAYKGVHENASGKFSSTAEAFFEGWKNSAPHWNTLIDSKLTRIGFVIYHHNGIENYYYGYTESDMDYPDIPGRSYIPYTGDFSNKAISSYKINIISKYLTMKSENTVAEVNQSFLLRPEFHTFDTYSNGALGEQGYEFGSGSLDNDNGYWESGNPSVVSVNSNGNARTLQTGTAAVRFYVNGDKDKYYQNVITVKDYGNSAGWYTDDMGKTHYKGADGQDVSGWLKLDGDLYFLAEYFSGEYSAATDGRTVNNFDGKLINMTLSIDGTWYTFDKNGVAIKLNGKPDDSKPTPTPIPEKVSAPKAPLAAVTLSDYQYAKLTWKKPAEAKGYQVYAYDSISKKYKCIKTVTNASILSFKQKLGYGKTGTYKVRAYNLYKDGRTRVYGPFSKTVKVKTAALAPKLISISTKYKNTLVVNWKKAAAAEGCQIYRATSKNGKYSLVKTVTSNSTVSFKNTKLVKGKTYYYKIRSFRINTDSRRIYGRFSAAMGAKCK